MTTATSLVVQKSPFNIYEIRIGLSYRGYCHILIEECTENIDDVYRLLVKVTQRAIDRLGSMI